MKVLTKEAIDYIKAEKPPWAKFYSVEPCGSLVYYEEKPVYNESIELYLRVDTSTKIRRVKLPTHSVHAI